MAASECSRGSPACRVLQSLVDRADAVSDSRADYAPWLRELKDALYTYRDHGPDDLRAHGLHDAVRRAMVRRAKDKKTDEVELLCTLLPTFESQLDVDGTWQDELCTAGILRAVVKKCTGDELKSTHAPSYARLLIALVKGRQANTETFQDALRADDWRASCACQTAGVSSVAREVMYDRLRDSCQQGVVAAVQALLPRVADNKDREPLTHALLHLLLIIGSHSDTADYLLPALRDMPLQAALLACLKHERVDRLTQHVVLKLLISRTPEEEGLQPICADSTIRRNPDVLPMILAAIAAVRSTDRITATAAVRGVVALSTTDLPKSHLTEIAPTLIAELERALRDISRETDKHAFDRSVAACVGVVRAIVRSEIPALYEVLHNRATMAQIRDCITRFMRSVPGDMLAHDRLLLPSLVAVVDAMFGSADLVSAINILFTVINSCSGDSSTKEMRKRLSKLAPHITNIFIKYFGEPYLHPHHFLSHSPFSVLADKKGTIEQLVALTGRVDRIAEGAVYALAGIILADGNMLYDHLRAPRATNECMTELYHNVILAAADDGNVDLLARGLLVLVTCMPTYPTPEYQRLFVRACKLTETPVQRVLVAAAALGLHLRSAALGKQQRGDLLVTRTWMEESNTLKRVACDVAVIDKLFPTARFMHEMTGYLSIWATPPKKPKPAARADPFNGFRPASYPFSQGSSGGRTGAQEIPIKEALARAFEDLKRWWNSLEAVHQIMIPIVIGFILFVLFVRLTSGTPPAVPPPHAAEPPTVAYWARTPPPPRRTYTPRHRDYEEHVFG